MITSSQSTPVEEHVSATQKSAAKSNQEVEPDFEEPNNPAVPQSKVTLSDKDSNTLTEGKVSPSKAEPATTNDLNTIIEDDNGDSSLNKGDKATTLEISRDNL